MRSSRSEPARDSRQSEVLTDPPVLEINGLLKEFARPRSWPLVWRKPEPFVAVRGVDLQVRRGEIVGLVGESGCGKSTLARCVVGSVEPTAGEIRLNGEEVPARRSITDRRRIQMVFQDPYSALNPARRVGDIIEEILVVHRIVKRSEARARCVELLEAVGLDKSFLNAQPRALSGGQRQRVSIARSLALEPELIIADEVVSALDVSVQAAILNLLLDLRDRLGLSLLFISHNLAVIRQVCDRVAVMSSGSIVEEQVTDELFRNPRHHYTRTLLAAVPRRTTTTVDVTQQ